MRKLLSTAIVALIFASCAKEITLPTSDFPAESLKAWIAKNDPKAEFKDGIYVRFIERSNIAGADEPELDSVWVKWNFTMRNLNGIVVATRYESVARLIGTWKNTTHFIPSYLYFSNFTPQINEGLKLAIASMHEGDSARFYIPSSLGYSDGQTYYESDAYAGESAIFHSYPTSFDIRLLKIVRDPRAYELELLNDYAQKNWGLSPSDTLAPSIFKRTLISNPKGDTITRDSTVAVYFTQTFLDDFMIDTNIDSVARARDRIMSNTSYAPIMASGDTLMTDLEQKIFARAVISMRKGETAEFANGSRWSYGSSGKPTFTPAIQPWAPLYIRIRVLTDQEYKDYLKEEEDEEDNDKKE